MAHDRSGALRTKWAKVHRRGGFLQRDLDKKQSAYDENGRKTYRDSVELVAFDPTSSSIATYSRDLGPKLLDFVHAIDVHPDSTLTAEAHSYGSAALGIAESEGLRVDRVMYVDGAGLGNDNTSVQDFPYTKDVPHYTQMARRDSVVGLIQGADAGELGHGASALRDPEVTRLETGYLNAANRSEGDIESTGVFESHSSIYTKGSTAFNNIVGVITGTRVEVYAQDEILVAGGKLYNIDGIDAEGYEPRYLDVE